MIVLFSISITTGIFHEVPDVSTHSWMPTANEAALAVLLCHWTSLLCDFQWQKATPSEFQCAVHHTKPCCIRTHHSQTKSDILEFTNGRSEIDKARQVLAGVGYFKLEWCPTIITLPLANPGQRIKNHPWLCLQWPGPSFQNVASFSHKLYTVLY